MSAESVTLSDSERRIARWVARSRKQNNRSSGVTNGRMGPQGDDETDIIGAEGELAFCKLINVYPDLTVVIQGHTYDCLFDGLRIDVKASGYDAARLVATIAKRAGDCDVYALMIGQNGVYRCPGWTYSTRLICQRWLTDLGHGPTYAMPQTELLPLESLLRG